MKTTGLFTTHYFKARATGSEPLRLVLFGDIHRDSPNHAHHAWQEFLDYARSLKNAVFLGMGDYIDSASTSERITLQRGLHESTTRHLEDVADGNVEILSEELGFMAGRLIGLLNGNHYFQYISGMNSDQKLCDKLGCRFLGVSSFIRVGVSAGGNTVLPLDIWAHHGKGGGRLLGGSINSVDQMREHAEADLYCMGHDHKRAVVPAIPRLRLRMPKRGEPTVNSRQQWLARTGSFLASYEPGEVNYNVDAGRAPCSLGHVELEITPLSKNDKGAKNRYLKIRGIA